MDKGRWVFGYGSLIWRPGFAFQRREPALLRGAHRQLCLYSHHYRGTPERPGLVMGLERGGACRGIAFEVAPAKWEEVYAYLVEREARGDAYRESWRNVDLSTGERVKALAFMVNRAAPNYAGKLPREELLRLVRQGTGSMGRNADYVINTARHLGELGFGDELLDWLSEALQREAG
ncbi:MAG: gamma-glutamylcyclotransferase [Cucumibacter sp.]